MRLRAIGRVAVGLAVAAVLGGPAAAQEMTFFTIGTGGTNATYYPLGGVIANAVSNPPGSRPCEDGGSCGVPGLIAVPATKPKPTKSTALTSSAPFCRRYANIWL